MKPTIDLINEATTPLGVSITELVDALQVQVDRDFEPVWGLGCILDAQPASRPNVWRMIFLDDADQADALGYHELTPDGLPQAKVFVRTTIQDNSAVSVTASHELLEMLADPKIDQTAERLLIGRTYALEDCDAVEATTYNIGVVPVSNFQYPAWFAKKNPHCFDAHRYDHLGRCSAAWQILEGGYMSILEFDGWGQIFGSVKAASDFKASARWRPQVRELDVRRRSTR